jgi:hypothetical protein
MAKSISGTLFDLFDGWSDVTDIDQEASTIKYIKKFEEAVKALHPDYDVDIDFQLNTTGPDQFNVDTDGDDEAEDVRATLSHIGDKLFNDSGSWLVMIDYAALAANLNTYKGNNVWEDVVRGLPGYDNDATDKADPNCMNDTIVFQGGTIIGYDEASKTWRVR